MKGQKDKSYYEDTCSHVSKTTFVYKNKEN